jgi:hypothetical protein
MLCQGSFRSYLRVEMECEFGSDRSISFQGQRSPASKDDHADGTSLRDQRIV